MVFHGCVSVQVVTGAGRHGWLYRVQRKRGRENGMQLCAPKNSSPSSIVRCVIWTPKLRPVRPGYNTVPSVKFRPQPRDVLLLCALGYISTMTLVDGLLTKNENCSLPPWIFIELLNCYMEFVRNVAMCQSHIKAELHENVGVPKSFLSHKIHRFKKYMH